MKLSQIESEEQLLWRLEKGDEELRQDIDETLDLMFRYQIDDWNRATVDIEEGIWEPKDEAEMLLQREDFDPVRLLEDVGVPEEELDQLTRLLTPEKFKELVAYEVKQAGEGDSRSFLGFMEDSRSTPSGYIVRDTYIEYRVGLDDEPYVWVPFDLIEKVLGDVRPHMELVEWENLGGLEWSSGWIHRDVPLLLIAQTSAREWALDEIRSALSDLVDAEPKEAVAALKRYLKESDPALLKAFKKAKLPLDVQASFAVAFFEDPDEGIVIIREALGEFGYEGSRGQTILEVDRAALRELGITSGRWWDGATWRLVNLPPQELAYEGTLMRHCVGRHDMGYRRAVELGDAQIWSLRSKFNKPVLTWEIDAERWRKADSPVSYVSEAVYYGELGIISVPHGDCERGRAVDQLKGKLNRASGEERDEALVLSYIFARLHIAPWCVTDFVGTKFSDIFPPPYPSQPFAENPSGFNRPWVPYRQRSRARPVQNPWFGPRTCYRTR